MGNHFTFVSNGLFVPVKVEVHHSRDKCECLWINPGESKYVHTSHGTVTINLFDPGRQYTINPCQSVTLPSDRSVVIKRNRRGKPGIQTVVYGSLWLVE